MPGLIGCSRTHDLPPPSIARITLLDQSGVGLWPPLAPHGPVKVAHGRAQRLGRRDFDGDLGDVP